jgi:hypothetical protein
LRPIEVNALQFGVGSRNSGGRRRILGSRGLLGMVSLRWVVLFALASIPLLVFLLVIFCIALVVLPVFALLAAIPGSVLYVLSSRHRAKSEAAGQPIDVEYRIVSHDDRDGPQEPA